MMVISGMIIGWIAAKPEAKWWVNLLRVAAGIGAIGLAYYAGKGVI